MDDKNTPIVSIIIPCYNVERYIETCLDSIFKQDYNLPFDIIAVNDGSTDATLLVLEKYKDKLYKIEDSTNHGVAYARKLGASLARTKYVVFVDADDSIEPSYLSTLVAEASSSVMPFVLWNTCSDGQKKLTKEPATTYIGQQAVKYILGGKTMCTMWRTIFETQKFLNTKNNSLTYCEDVIFVLRYLLDNNLGIKVLDKQLYNYSIGNPTSATAAFYSSKHLQSFVDIPFIIKDYLLPYNSKLYNKLINNDLAISLIRTYRIIDYKSFKKLFNSPQYDFFRKNKAGKLLNIRYSLYYFCFKHKLYFIIKFFEDTLFIKRNRRKKIKYTQN